MVYLIHFDKPFHHAKHYIGYVHSDLGGILEAHRNGYGSKVLRALMKAGIGWQVVKLWKEGGRKFEKQLKRRKKTSVFCPICRGRERDLKQVSLPMIQTWTLATLTKESK